MHLKSLTKVGVGMIFSTLLVVSGFSFNFANPEAENQDSNLAENMNAILSDEGLKGAIAGVSVRSAETGELLYEHHGDTRLTPASNMKLITAAAALHFLGHDYQFTTDISTDGKIKGRVLKGNLYLIGRGDPTLLKEDFDTFAKDLREEGIKQIQGNLVGDASWFDDKKLSEDMIWTDESEYYGAQVSALTFSPNKDYDAGTIIVEVYPGDKEGEKAEVVTSPKSDYVTIENNATTGNHETESDIVINRKHGTNTITIEGVISLKDARERSWISVSNPARYALHLFNQSLKEEGIEVKGDLEVAAAPRKIDIISSKKSMQLHELLIPFMKLSNNGHAEILIKEIGKRESGEGSWEAGLEIVTGFLEEEGLNADELLLRDGSGISHVSLIQPNQLSLLLHKLQSKKWFNYYFESLPIAGSKERLVGGTLRNRMNGTSAENKIYAKTGTLQGVSSLSGYVKSEKPLVFSIILNQFLDEEKMEEIEDRIAIALAEYKEKS